jgi:hypothetical protein
VTVHVRRLSAALLGVALLAAPAAAQEKKEPPKTAGKGTLADKLARKVTVEKTEGKFGDVVRQFAEKFDLPLVIDPTTTIGEPDMPAGGGAENTVVKLPALVNVRLGTALRLLCDQVSAAYLVYPDVIRIVNVKFALYETGELKNPPEPDASGDEHPPILSILDLEKAKPLIKRALVTAAFRKAPLEDVLDDIAETTGATVVLSPEVGAKAQAELTARFANTPVDAAVRTLCELTDLGVIEDANVLVVTTRERAAARAKAEDEKRKARQPQQSPLGFGVVGNFGLGGPVVPAELAVELGRLKEQNEKLQKEVEELRKMLKK